jgi:NitT/TauT family transport system substrate-binding protein
VKKALSLLLGLLLALSVAACGDDEGASTTTDGSGTTAATTTTAPAVTYNVTMGMAHNDTFTSEWWGWLAAREMGYYEDLGLNVEFIPTGGSGAAVEQLAAGNLDCGNPSMPSVGEALLADIPLVDIYTYSNGAIFGIFTLESTGITDIPGMAGKKIGISEPGGGEVAFLEAALRAAGLDPISDVTLIPIGSGGPETFTAIQNGDVDAYASAYNDVFAMQVQGLSLLDLTPPIFNTFPARGIICRPDVVANDPEALKRLARGTAMGTHFCFANLDACEAIMKRVIPQVWEENSAGVSQGSLRYALAQQQVRPADPSRYGAHNVEGTQSFIDTIAATMESPAAVDIDAFLNTDFLDYANDFDRAAVEADAQNFSG